MNPLAITITPPLPLQLGEKNLRAFVESGFNHISINPDYEAMRMLNLLGFREMGFPYYGWLIAIQAGVVRMASQLNIKLIFYGEDGEVEYGGSDQTSSSPIYDVNYMKAIYLEGGYDKILRKSEIKKSNLFFFEFPNDNDLKNSGINMTHWSYYENWDPYRNYLVAKEHCGLIEAEINNSGTFTNFAQNDQALYTLHAYLMYLKFGFGRATQDACIEIRRGAMTRAQAINLVRLYDGQYPSEFIPMYLEYYKITLEEFGLILDRWVNRNLFTKDNGLWKPSFSIQ
jgi:N-acetyl sugar amidotransferase